MERELTKRDQAILQAIISCYINTGEPVGSRYLSKKLDFSLSPATIRNIMADLEEIGLLRQPHVSAGRVPTDKAYRFFVDSLVRSCGSDPAVADLEKIYRSLRGETETVMRGTSKALSDISRYMGLVTAPRFVNTVLRHIEFVRLQRNRVLAILVSQEGIIQNRLVETDREYSQKELEKYGSLLTARYANRPLGEARAAILREMADDKLLYDSLLRQAMDLAHRSLRSAEGGGDVYVDGTSNIFSLPEFADVEKMKSLFKAFEEKSHLVDILDRCIEAEGVKIFIGAENPHHELQDLSLVTAPYRKNDQVLGVIGVLGPTRMEYDRIIPMVEYTARYLTHLLTKGF